MRILQIIGAALILFTAPALAKDGGSARWTVTQSSGDVRVVRAGMQPASLQPRSMLSPGDVVATGTTGRAVLTRGNDYVVVAPGSKLILPKEEKSGFTRLLQEVGTMLYKVRPTGVPHFAVETPLLAAVVKGTSFTVVVDEKRAAVQVTEGLVEVNSTDGSARRLVERGATVFIDRERPGQINEVGPESFASPESDQSAVKVEKGEEVALTAVADLTGGLVRAAPVATAGEGDSKPVAGTLTVSGISADTKRAVPVASGIVVTDVMTPPPGAAVATPVVTLPGLNVPDFITPPAVSPVASPIVTPIAAIAPVVAAPVPLVAPVVTPVVAPIVAPVVTPVVAPIVAPS